ncbi:hypothetical protein PR202_ga12171 [Eleusine coracana subsp. coracana]|uniref:Uncharacterized protein n=1 Tax=Eleusine coracana subsp. coracana TaxID=191504 RepID=A0AAV5CBD6_ELECO|nr:hypothetical protein PR202_ga12171 [Eleusine coracana subsp. coracana]
MKTMSSSSVLLLIIGAPPVMLGTSTLNFCDMISGISCCDAATDEMLREQFEGMDVVDAVCAAIVKDTLCATCLPSSPFHMPGSTDPKPSSSIPPQCISPEQDDAMCLERIGATAYLSMASHLDGSGRVFVSTPDGKISLASVPATGTGAILRAVPFLDLTDQVVALMGVAFHPEFATNGRFFVSYNCDSRTSPTCITSGAPGNGSSPFQYQLVVAEFSADSAQQVDSVHLISKGGNCSGPPDNATFRIVSYGPPVPGSNTKPSIVGGLVYRGSADPSLKGRYLYVYGFNVWAAVETPMSSGRYASALISNIMCSEGTPLPCTGGGIGGHVISWGEDNSKDGYILATDGVYKVLPPGLCGGAPSRSSSGLAWRLSTVAGSLAILISIFWKLFMAKQPVTNCNGWFGCCTSNSVSCWCCNSYN